MDIRKVKKLIELLEESGIAEIEIKEGEEAVRISRAPTGHAMPQYYSAPPPAPVAAPVAVAAAPAAAGVAPGGAPLARRKDDANLVTAPMVGTFYAAGSPTAKQLRSWVRPGVFEVWASFLRLPSALSSDDLPTFERPTTATSAWVSGRRSRASADSRKRRSRGALMAATSSPTATAPTRTDAFGWAM